MARANHRSPNYPRLAFDAALEKARIVYDRHHKHPVSRESIAQTLGYTTAIQTVDWRIAAIRPTRFEPDSETRVVAPFQQDLVS